MATLKIGNSYSQLEDLTVEQYKRVKTAMSYTTDSGPGTRPRTASLLSKKLEFPTGLLYLIDFPLTRVDLRIRPATRPDASQTLFLPDTSPEPYLEQKAAIEALMTRGGRGVITAPTGFGKSLMVAMAIDRLAVPALVVVPSLELKRQLTESLRGWFGDDNCRRHVTVANVDSLDPEKPLKGIQAVIVDEVHHSAAKTYRKLNRYAWNDVYYRIGFSATPWRNDDSERLLFESFLSRVVYRVSYKTAVDQKYIVPMECYYLDIPKIPLKGNQKHYGAMYSECVVEHDQRNNLIGVTLGRLHSQKRATLCLVREIRHGDILSTKTGFPFANGKDGLSEQLIAAFNSGEINTLIATTGVMGEGIDSKRAEWVLLAAAGKAKSAFMQQCGRVFRNYPGKETCKVLLFADTAHAWFRKHFREQVKIVQEEYGVEPLKIEL